MSIMMFTSKWVKGLTRLPIKVLRNIGSDQYVMRCVSIIVTYKRIYF